MSLEGAKFITLDKAGNHGDIVLAKGRKFLIGYYVSCDFVLADERAKGVHCEIECDAFGRVTIRNLSPDKPILVNGSSVEVKRILLNNSKLSILDKEYLWQFSKISSNEFVDLTGEAVSTPQKQIGIPEQAPNSCPDFKLHRELPKRLTVHNFAYCIQSDEEGNTSVDSNDESITEDKKQENQNEIKDRDKEVHKNQINKNDIESEDNTNDVKKRSVTPEPPLKNDNSTALLETPKMNLINCTNDKANKSTQKKNNHLLTLCQPSDVVITSFSPRETGVKIEKSFTAILNPKVLATKPPTTPKSVYSTPKSQMGLDDNEDDRELLSFHTPSTSKKAAGTASKVLKKSSMHLIDFTTPHRLRPGSPFLKSALKASTKKNLTETTDKTSAKSVLAEQFGLSTLSTTPLINCNNSGLETPNSVISVSSTDTSSVVEVTSDGSELRITPSSSAGLITPIKSQASVGVCTPMRTPQSLMKRAILTSAKKPTTTPQKGTIGAPATTPHKDAINRIPLRSNLALLGSPVTPTKSYKSESQLPRRYSMSTPTRKSIAVVKRLDNSPTTSNFNPSSPSSSTSFASRRSSINPISVARALPTSTPLAGSSYKSNFRNRAACKTSPLQKARKSVLDMLIASHIPQTRKSIALPGSTSKHVSFKEKSPQQIASDRLVSRARKSFYTSPTPARAGNNMMASSIIKDRQIERKPVEQRKVVLFADKQPSEGGGMDDLSRTFIVVSDEEEDARVEKATPKDATFSPGKDKKIEQTDKSKATTTINTTFSPEKKTGDKENVPLKDEKDELLKTFEIAKPEDATFSPEKHKNIEETDKAKAATTINTTFSPEKKTEDEKDELLKTFEIPVDVEEITARKEEKEFGGKMIEKNKAEMETETTESSVGNQEANANKNRNTNKELPMESKTECKEINIEKQGETADERSDKIKIINQKQFPTDKEENKKDNKGPSAIDNRDSLVAEEIFGEIINDAKEDIAVIVDTHDVIESIEIPKDPQESSKTEISTTNNALQSIEITQEGLQEFSQTESQESFGDVVNIPQEETKEIVPSQNKELHDKDAEDTKEDADKKLVKESLEKPNKEKLEEAEVLETGFGEESIIVDLSEVSSTENPERNSAEDIKLNETRNKIDNDDHTKLETIDLVEDYKEETIATKTEAKSNSGIVQESKIAEHLAREGKPTEENQGFDDSDIIIIEDNNTQHLASEEKPIEEAQILANSEIIIEDSNKLVDENTNIEAEKPEVYKPIYEDITLEGSLIEKETHELEEHKPNKEAQYEDITIEGSSMNLPEMKAAQSEDEICEQTPTDSANDEQLDVEESKEILEESKTNGEEENLLRPKPKTESPIAEAKTDNLTETSSNDHEIMLQIEINESAEESKTDTIGEEENQLRPTHSLKEPQTVSAIAEAKTDNLTETSNNDHEIVLQMKINESAEESKTDTIGEEENQLKPKHSLKEPQTVSPIVEAKPDNLTETSNNDHEIVLQMEINESAEESKTDTIGEEENQLKPKHSLKEPQTVSPIVEAKPDNLTETSNNDHEIVLQMEINESAEESKTDTIGEEENQLKPKHSLKEPQTVSPIVEAKPDNLTETSNNDHEIVLQMEINESAKESKTDTIGEEENQLRPKHSLKEPQTVKPIFEAKTDNLTETSNNDHEIVLQMEINETAAEPLTEITKVNDQDLSVQEYTNNDDSLPVDSQIVVQEDTNNDHSPLENSGIVAQEDTNYDHSVPSKDSQIGDQFELKESNKSHQQTEDEIDKVAQEKVLQGPDAFEQLDLDKSEIESNENTSKLLEEIDDVLNKSDEIKQKHFEQMQGQESETPLTEEFESEGTTISVTDQNRKDTEDQDKDIITKNTKIDTSTKIEHENLRSQKISSFPSQGNVLIEAENQRMETQSEETVADTESHPQNIVDETKSRKNLLVKVIPATSFETNKNIEETPADSSIMKKTENTPTLTTKGGTRRSSISAEVSKTLTAESSITPRRSTRRTSLSTEVVTLTPRRSTRRASMSSEPTNTPTKNAIRRASLSADYETPVTPKRASSRKSSVSMDDEQPVLEAVTPRAKTPRKQLVEQRIPEEMADNMNAIVEEEEEEYKEIVSEDGSKEKEISESKENGSENENTDEIIAEDVLKSEDKNDAEERREIVSKEIVEDVAKEIDTLESKGNENTDEIIAPDVLKVEEKNDAEEMKEIDTQEVMEDVTKEIDTQQSKENEITYEIIAQDVLKEKNDAEERREIVSKEVMEDVVKEIDTQQNKENENTDEIVAENILKVDEKNDAEERKGEIVSKDDILESKLEDNAEVVAEEVLQTEGSNVDEETVGLDAKPKADDDLEIINTKDIHTNVAVTDEVVSVETHFVGDKKKSAAHLKRCEVHKSQLKEDNAIVTNDNKDIVFKITETIASSDEESAEEFKNEILESKEIVTPKSEKSVRIVADSPKTPVMMGMRELLKTPKAVNTPKFAGIRDLVRTPKLTPEHEEEEVEKFALLADLVKTPIAKVSKDVEENVEEINTSSTEMNEVSTPKTKKSIQLISNSPETPIMTGMRNLLKTPKAELNTPKFSGIRELVKTPEIKHENEEEEVEKLAVVALLVKTPTTQSFLEEKEVEEIATTSAKGVIVSTPKAKKSVKIIDGSPKTPTMTGVRELLKTPKADKTPKFAGIRNLVQTPKQSTENEQEEVEKLAGVAVMVKTPPAKVSQDLEEIPTTSAKNTNLRGVRELLKTPKSCSTPRFKGMRELMQTPKMCSTPLMAGIKELMNSSPAIVDNKNMDKFLKTPTAKNIMISSLPSSAVIEKSTDSIEVSTEYDLNATNEGGLSNLEDLFKTPVASRFVERITASCYDEDDEDQDKTATLINQNVNETLQEKLNKSAEDAFDKLTGQESQMQTPIRKIYSRKSSLAMQTPQAQSQSPFSKAEVLSDLPKTDVEEWIETLDQAETPIVVEDNDDDGNVGVEKETESVQEVLVDEVSYLEDQDKRFAPDESIIPETCAKVYLNEKCLANVTSSSEVMFNLSSFTKTDSKDPLASTTTKLSTKITRPVTPMDAEISGIDLLDQTMESVQEEPLKVEEPSIFEEHLVVSDNESEADVTINNDAEFMEDRNNLRNLSLAAYEEDENDLSEPLLVSDSEDLNLSVEELKEITEENFNGDVKTSDFENDDKSFAKDPLEMELVESQKTAETENETNNDSKEENISMVKPESSNNSEDEDKESLTKKGSKEETPKIENLVVIEGGSIIEEDVIEDVENLVSFICENHKKDITEEESAITEEISNQDYKNLAVSPTDDNPTEDSENNKKSLTENEETVIVTKNIENSVLEDTIIEDSLTESKRDDDSKVEIISPLEEATCFITEKVKSVEEKTTETTENEKNRNETAIEHSLNEQEETSTASQNNDEHQPKEFETLIAATKATDTKVMTTTSEELLAAEAPENGNVLENVREKLKAGKLLEQSGNLETQIEHEKKLDASIKETRKVSDTFMDESLNEISNEAIKKVEKTVDITTLKEAEINNDTEESKKESVQEYEDIFMDSSSVNDNSKVDDSFADKATNDEKDVENESAMVEVTTREMATKDSETDLSSGETNEDNNKSINEKYVAIDDQNLSKEVLVREDIQIEDNSKASSYEKVKELSVQNEDQLEEILTVQEISDDENQNVTKQIAEPPSEVQEITETITEEFKTENILKDQHSNICEVVEENIKDDESVSQNNKDTSEDVQTSLTETISEDIAVAEDYGSKNNTESNEIVSNEILETEEKSSEYKENTTELEKEFQEHNKTKEEEDFDKSGDVQKSLTENISEDIAENKDNVSKDITESHEIESNQNIGNPEKSSEYKENTTEEHNKTEEETFDVTDTAQTQSESSKEPSEDINDILESRNKLKQNSKSQLEQPVPLPSTSKEEKELGTETIEEIKTCESNSEAAQESSIVDVEEFLDKAEQNLTLPEELMESISKSMDLEISKATEKESKNKKSSIKEQSETSKTIQHEVYSIVPEQSEISKIESSQGIAGLDETTEKDQQNSVKVKTVKDKSFKESTEVGIAKTSAQTAGKNIEIVQTYDIKIKIIDTETKNRTEMKSDSIDEFLTENIDSKCSSADLAESIKEKQDPNTVSVIAAEDAVTAKSEETKAQSNASVEKLIDEKYKSSISFEVKESANKDAEEGASSSKITVEETTVCMVDAKTETAKTNRRKRTASDSSQGSVHDEDTKSARGRRKIRKTPVEETLVEEIKENEDLQTVASVAAENSQESVEKHTNKNIDVENKELQKEKNLELPAVSNHNDVKETVTEKEKTEPTAGLTREEVKPNITVDVVKAVDKAKEQAADVLDAVLEVETAEKVKEQVVKRSRRKPTVSESSQGSVHDDDSNTRRGRRKVKTTQVEEPLLEESQQNEELPNESTPDDQNNEAQETLQSAELSADSPRQEDDFKSTKSLHTNEILQNTKAEEQVSEVPNESVVQAERLEERKEPVVKRGRRKPTVSESSQGSVNGDDTTTHSQRARRKVQKTPVEEMLKEEELPTTSSTTNIPEKKDNGDTTKEKHSTVSLEREEEPLIESTEFKEIPVLNVEVTGSLTEITEKPELSLDLSQKEDEEQASLDPNEAKTLDVLKQAVKPARRKKTVSESSQDSVHDENSTTRRGRRKILKTPVDKTLVEEKQESEEKLKELVERTETLPPKETNQRLKISTEALALDEAVTAEAAKKKEVNLRHHKPIETELGRDSKKPLIEESLGQVNEDENTTAGDKEKVVAEVKKGKTINKKSETNIVQAAAAKSSQDDKVKEGTSTEKDHKNEGETAEEEVLTAKRSTKRGASKLTVSADVEPPKSRSKSRNRKSPARQPSSTISELPAAVETRKEQVDASENYKPESTAKLDKIVIPNEEIIDIKQENDYIEKDLKLKLKSTKVRGKRIRTASDSSQGSTADEEPTKRRARQHKQMPDIDEVVVEEPDVKIVAQTGENSTTDNLTLNNVLAEETANEKKDDELVKPPTQSINNDKKGPSTEDIVKESQSSLRGRRETATHEEQSTKTETLREKSDDEQQSEAKEIVDQPKNIKLSAVQITEVNLEPENQRSSPDLEEKEVRGRRGGRHHVVAEDEHHEIKHATKRRAAVAKQIASNLQESAPVGKRRVGRRKQDHEQEEHAHVAHVTADDCTNHEEATSAATIIIHEEPKKSRTRRNKEHELIAEREHPKISKQEKAEMEVSPERTAKTESASTSSKRRIGRRKPQEEHDHGTQVTADDRKRHEEKSMESPTPEEPKKVRGRKKKDEPPEEPEQSTISHSPEAKHRSRKRKESHTDHEDLRHQHKDDQMQQAETDSNILTADIAPLTPKRGRKTSAIDVDKPDHILAKGAEDTPSKRPLRKAATVYHNYDETSNDAVMPAKTKKKPDSPRKSLEAAKSSPTATITTATIAGPIPTSSSTAATTTARGRTRKPTAKVQQFLEEERAKAETPKKRALLMAATDTPTPQRMAGRRGRKPSVVDVEVDTTVETPQTSKRGRPKAIAHTEELQKETTAIVIEEKKTEPKTPPTSAATAAKGRRIGRKAKPSAEDHNHDEDEPPPSKKSPLVLEAEKQETSPALEAQTPTRTAARRGAATAAKARIEEDALAAAAIDQPKKSRAKKPLSAKIIAAATTDTEDHSSEMDEEQSKAKSVKAEDLNSVEDNESDIVEKPVIKRGARKVAASTSATDSPAVPSKRGRKGKNASEATEDETVGEGKAATRSRKNVDFDKMQAAEKAAQTLEHHSKAEKTSEESAAPVKRGTRTRRK